MSRWSPLHTSEMLADPLKRVVENSVCVFRGGVVGSVVFAFDMLAVAVIADIVVGDKLAQTVLTSTSLVGRQIFLGLVPFPTSNHASVARALTPRHPASE